MDRLSSACKAFNLVISVKKTVILTQEGIAQAHIKLDNKELETVDKFCYLGSTITCTTSLDDEINVRIGKAATTFGRLTKRARENKRLKIKTKIKIYEACVLSALLYGSETWTLYSRQEKRLNTFHLRCLRKILGITWSDKISNVEVLDQTILQSMTSILCMRRLRWLRHVKRMDDSRIPKQLLYGELSQGKRQRGRPKLRYKDACKTSLSKCEIDVKTKDEIAVDRTKWRATVKELLCSKIASGTTRLRNVSDERKTTAVQNAAASPWYANTVAEAVVPRSEESAMKEAASKGLSRAYHEMTLLSLTDRLKRRKGPYNTRVNSTFYAY